MPREYDKGEWIFVMCVWFYSLGAEKEFTREQWRKFYLSPLFKYSDMGMIVEESRLVCKLDEPI